MKKTYGIVIVGCGHIGLEHLEAMYYRDDVKLIGTVDVKEESARFAAKKFGLFRSHFCPKLDHKKR